MLTKVETVLLCAILARGGKVESLFKLSTYADLAYNNAYHGARRLEARGLLTISKPRKALVLRVNL